MFNFPRRLASASAGRGALIVALVAMAGYGVGLAHNPAAALSAAPAAASASAATDGTRLVAAAGAQASYAPIVDTVAPAVVTVRVEKRASLTPAQFPGGDDFFRFFGRELPVPRGQRPRMPRQSGLGSGVVTTPDGYILTNNHVIEGADRVRVELTDRRTFDATVVGTDPASDLAVLKIEAADLPTVAIGDSNGVRVGDVVLAIGNPLGVGQTVTMGIISAKGRATGVGDGSYEDFLQTDAPINQGNSGGALVNLHGELVGINSQIMTPTGGNIGLGFAIPSNMAREVMDQLRSHGRVSRGKLGVTVQSLTPDLAASLALPNVSGALVSGVESGSPAERAGLRAGDVVTALDGGALADSNALRNRIAGTRPGSTVALDVVRDGRSRTIEATLGALEPRQARAGRGDGEGGDGPSFGATGMAVTPLTPELARQLDLSRTREGLVVRDLDPDGAAAAAGLREGDVISRVDGEAVRTVDDLRSALAASGDRPALLLVTRENADIFLALRSPKS